MGMVNAEERIATLGIKSYEQMFFYTGLLYIFKVMHGYIAKSPFFPERSVVRHTRGNSYKLAHPSCRTETRKSFFHIRLLSYWNALPEKIVSSRSISAFNHHLRSSVISMSFD